MKILLDENKRIIAYTYIGDLQGSIEVEDFDFEHPSQDYMYEKGEIKYSPDLVRIKKEKRDELKEIRTNKLYENITVNGDIFQVRKDDLDNFSYYLEIFFSEFEKYLLESKDKFENFEIISLFENLGKVQKYVTTNFYKTLSKIFIEKSENIYGA